MAPALVVSVVVPTYRRTDRVERLLGALGDQTMAPDTFEVLVVDDCSGDGTLARLEAAAADSPFVLRAMTTPANGGPAVARNVGWREARAPLIAFIDDDCVPAPLWLASGVAALEADGRIGVLQGHTCVPEGVAVEALGPWAVWREIEGPTPHFEGCNIFYRRDALAATGGFDEDLRWWGEDSAAGWKVVEAGWTRGYAADAIATHDVEVRDFRWHWRNHYLERNFVRLAAEHPGFRRDYFWRPWAVTRHDAALAVGVAGAIASIWWRPLALALLPYLWWRRPPLRRPGFLRVGVTTLVLDSTRCAGHLVASARHRILVL